MGTKPSCCRKQSTRRYHQLTRCLQRSRSSRKASGATFLVFVDYLRAPLRVASLSELLTNYILTHDSVAVGEDGPTHQPVETVSSLRLMPNLDVIRPAMLKRLQVLLW